MTSLNSDLIHVLLVDDEPEFIELVVDLLESEGDKLVTSTAVAPEEGLELLNEQDIDCVVADYILNGTDGIEFLEMVRAECGDIPFVLLTGRGSGEIAARAMANGVTDYVPKATEPDQIRILANRIESTVERHRSQRALEASQRELDRSFERITDGFFSVDDEWRYTFVNQQGAEFVGHSPEAMVGNTVWEIFPGLKDSPFEEAFRTATAEQESIHIEEFYPPHDRWYSVSVYPDENGLSIYFRPIDERKQFEEAIVALHEVANDLSQLDSVEAICERSIGAAENLLDFDLSLVAIEEAGMLQPKAVSSEMTADDFEAISVDEGIAGKTFLTGESYLIDDIDAHPETDHERWSSLLSIPIGEHGNFQAGDEETHAFDERDLRLAQLLMSHTTDHLDRLANKRKLKRQIERLDEFAGIVSHDLRNPLNVAMGHLELAASECETGHHADIEQALNRMDELIEDLLSLARLGTSVTDMEAVSLEVLAENCQDNVDTGHVTFSVETTQTIHADESRLQQLLENLYRNAVEHAGPDCTCEWGA